MTEELRIRPEFQPGPPPCPDLSEVDCFTNRRWIYRDMTYDPNFGGLSYVACSPGGLCTRFISQPVRRDIEPSFTSPAPFSQYPEPFNPYRPTPFTP